MKVVAVISGGIDSIGYAAIWKKKHKCKIYPLIFNYGQKATKEIDKAKMLCLKLQFEEPLIIDILPLKQIWKQKQLTDENINVKEKYEPSVVVPLRNAIFLTIASAYAKSMGAKYVIYGAHLDDVKINEKTGEPLYPDCTVEFAKLLERALNKGHFKKAKIKIYSPAREHYSKSKLLILSYSTIGDLIFETWSCYLSGKFHCGKCESCINRQKAFKKAGIKDKTIYLNEV